MVEAERLEADDPTLEGDGLDARGVGHAAMVRQPRRRRRPRPVDSTSHRTLDRSPPVSDFAARVDAFLAEFFALHPLSATSAGMHDHDAEWPDLTEAGRARGSRSTTAGRPSSRAFADADLDRDERVDRDLLLGELAAYRFAETELREDDLEPARVGLHARRRDLPAARPGVRAAGRPAGLGRRAGSRGCRRWSTAARAASARGDRPVSRLHTETALAQWPASPS